MSKITQKFDDLTPIKYLGLKGNKNWYLCQCSCGGKISVSSSGLINKNARDCGCKNRFSGKDHGLYKGYEEISSSLWSQIKYGAVSRNLEFNITIEDAWDLFITQNRRCSLTDIELVFAKNRKQMSTTTASIDRIDSSQGYILDNIQWVHKDVNMMKTDLDERYFINMCRLVINHKRIQ